MSPTRDLVVGSLKLWEWLFYVCTWTLCWNFKFNGTALWCVHCKRVPWLFGSYTCYSKCWIQSFQIFKQRHEQRKLHTINLSQRFATGHFEMKRNFSGLPYKGIQGFIENERLYFINESSNLYRKAVSNILRLGILDLFHYYFLPSRKNQISPSEGDTKNYYNSANLT